MAEPEHEEHRPAPAADDEDGKKDSLGRVLKKKPWLWLLITAGAGIAAWVIYQHFSGGSGAASTTGSAEPVDTSGDSGGGAAGGGLPDTSGEDQYLQELLTEDQAIGAELSNLQQTQPVTIDLYTGNPGSGTPSGSPAPPPSNPLTGGGQYGTGEIGNAIAAAQTYGGTALDQFFVQEGNPAQQTAALQAINPNKGTQQNQTDLLSALDANNGLAEAGKKTQAKTESSVPKSNPPGVTNKGTTLSKAQINSLGPG